MSVPPALLHPPADVLRIVDRLERHGYETWIVGGAVRDALLGREPTEWDLATAAPPNRVRELFRRTVPVGLRHGTVGVLGRDGVLYEVTTFRRDVATDGRHAEVVFTRSLEDDLARRDFTINALAWHPLRQELRDPFGGLEDLRRGWLRTVGDPAQRFAEDYLRVLRAFRFAGRYDLEIEPATWAALVAAVPHVPRLSAERIREELVKTMATCRRPSRALELYARSGALAVLYPELAATVGLSDGFGADVWTHQLRVVDALPPRPLLRIVGLVHDVGKARTPPPDFPGHAEAGAALVRDLLRRLRCSNAEVDRATHLVAQHAALPSARASDAELRFFLRRLGRAYLADFWRLRIAICRATPPLADQGAHLLTLWRRLRRILRERPPLQVSDLAIDGRDLRALGLPPGPVYGAILQSLLDRVTEDPGQNRPDVLRALARAEAERLGAISPSGDG